MGLPFQWIGAGECGDVAVKEGGAILFCPNDPVLPRQSADNLSTGRDGFPSRQCETHAPLQRRQYARFDRSSGIPDPHRI